MRGSPGRRLFVLGGLPALLAAHVALRPASTELWLGWIPTELGVRLLWIGAAWVWLLVLTAPAAEEGGARS